MSDEPVQVGDKVTYYDDDGKRYPGVVTLVWGSNLVNLVYGDKVEMAKGIGDARLASSVKHRDKAGSVRAFEYGW